MDGDSEGYAQYMPNYKIEIVKKDILKCKIIQSFSYNYVCV